MACNLATIERYMEALPTASPWEVDQHVSPVPWRAHLASGGKRLRIGFLVDDGVVRVQPPIARAMREVIEALKVAGHDGKKECILSEILFRALFGDKVLMKRV
jgi:amidase